MPAAGFPGGSDGKESARSAGDRGSIPGAGRSPGEGDGHPLQCSCLGNPMDRGSWRATVLEVPKESDTTEGLTSTLLLLAQRSQDGTHRRSLAVPRGWAQHYEAILQMRRSRLPANMLAELRHSLGLLTARSSLCRRHPGAQVPARQAGGDCGTRAGLQGGGRAFRGRSVPLGSARGRRSQAGSVSTAQSRAKSLESGGLGGKPRGVGAELSCQDWGPQARGLHALLGGSPAPAWACRGTPRLGYGRSRG